MRRIALILLAASGAFAAVAGADDTRTYKIELYNAFGIVEQADFRVGGVNVGSVTDLTVNEDKRAVVTVEVSGDLATLGDETTCESNPQSLLGEYFLDCDPAGQPLPDGGTIPASRVSQNVQPDLVQNTMREPFRLRLQLLLNEFGTALAGNADALNEAIRLGAPALTDLQKVTEILAGHNELIRDMNVNSERVSGELARVRDQVVEFVDEAEDVSSAALERRDDVSRGFDLFDDYIAELYPTLAQLGETARQQTPLLADLGDAAPELHRLTQTLPPFQRGSERSLETLGSAAKVGERALRRGRDEIDLLAEAGKPAPQTAEILADFVSDLDDPRRAVEINDLAADATGRTSTQPGTSNTMGYTALEGILNYAYYQALALNQFDRAGHALHIGLQEVFSGPCGEFRSGRNPPTGSGHELGDFGIPTEGGDITTVFEEFPACATQLGPNQPGLNEDLGLPKYHPSVCPEGTTPDESSGVANPATDYCDPTDPASARRPGRAVRRDGGGRGAAAGGDLPGIGDGGGNGPVDPDKIKDELEDILDLPGGALDGLGVGGKGGKKGLGGLSDGSQQAANDLLDLLFGP
jgi:ABC-type transporter Mla subunit MlaD